MGRVVVVGTLGVVVDARLIALHRVTRGAFSALIGGTLFSEAEGDAEGVAVAAVEAERTSLF